MSTDQRAKSALSRRVVLWRLISGLLLFAALVSAVASHDPSNITQAVPHHGTVEQAETVLASADSTVATVAAEVLTTAGHVEQMAPFLPELCAAIIGCCLLGYLLVRFRVFRGPKLVIVSITASGASLRTLLPRLARPVACPSLTALSISRI